MTRFYTKRGLPSLTMGLDGRLQHLRQPSEVIVSASADWTIALHTVEGVRIGSFSHRGPHWRLADPSTWCEQQGTAGEMCCQGGHSGLEVETHRLSTKKSYTI